VMASCGAGVPCVEPEEAGRLDFLFVCAGGNPTAFRDRATLAWLRSLAAQGVRIGGVSGGPVILAKAGIMDGYHMTVHWEHAPAVAEAYPNIMLTRSIYIIDRNRLTCAGGTAPLDMMHALIAEAHGPELARKVSDWFMHTDIRPAQSAQRASLTERYGVHDERLTAALELMESHPGEPLTRGEMARRIGLSTRQLDRLFAEKMKTSYADHSRRIRLERARDLLRQSAVSITEIALGCGFSSASHFSRAYRAAFGVTPASERR
jgi:transcriptional regulator GlxA family with amidase domain